MEQEDKEGITEALTNQTQTASKQLKREIDIAIVGYLQKIYPGKDVVVADTSMIDIQGAVKLKGMKDPEPFRVRYNTDDRKEGVVPEIVRNDDGTIRYYKCPNCVYPLTAGWKYCPNCGAKLNWFEVPKEGDVDE